MVRRKLARRHRQAQLLVESFTDDSEMDEEPDLMKKRGKALKSGKVRTADLTVIKRIIWPHELVYTSGCEPENYELISVPQCVTECLSVLDTVKAGEKQAMLKHLKELMAGASMYGLSLYEHTTECGYSSSRKEELSGMMLSSN